MLSTSILGVRYDALSTDQAADQLVAWAEAGEARYACFSNAHGTIEAQDDPAFMDVLNGADLNLPDGMSVVKEMRARGLDQRDRVYGPDVTQAVVQRAAQRGVPIALYGSTQTVLDALCERLPRLAPGVQIATAISPPFRALTEAEEAGYEAQIRDSGARIVLVGLGCPRQERWVAEHFQATGAVCLSVGAAFDFHAGLLRQAPAWIQQAGLEWAFRLAMEPRRLWRRYARIVPRFLIGAARERSRLPEADRPAPPPARHSPVSA